MVQISDAAVHALSLIGNNKPKQKWRLQFVFREQTFIPVKEDRGNIWNCNICSQRTEQLLLYLF